MLRVFDISGICTCVTFTLHMCGVQKRLSLRSASVPQVMPRSLSDNSTDVQVVLPPPRPCPMMPIHTNQPWFHGHISRDRSVSLLAEHGLVDGLVLNISTAVGEKFTLLGFLPMGWDSCGTATGLPCSWSR